MPGGQAPGSGGLPRGEDAVNLESKVSLLGGLPLFEDFGPDQLRLVAFNCSTRKYGDRQMLHREGDAARSALIVYSGQIAVTRQRVISYVLCGLFAAFAALCLVGETASADPLLGPSFTLTSISAVVLGGTALAGGRGGVIGSILGALTLGLINNIVFFAKLPYVTQDLVKGLIILAALAGGILGARR